MNQAGDIMEKIRGTLRESLGELRNAREELGEKQFRAVLESLGAEKEQIKDLSEIIRRFDKESMTFIMPYQGIIEKMGDDPERREKFLRAVHDFEPRSRSLEGGLNAFGKELREEREHIARLLRTYMRLYLRKPRLRDAGRKTLAEIESAFPAILVLRTPMKKVGRPKYREIATKIMIRYLPCTEKTLVQITRQKLDNLFQVKKRSKKDSKKLRKK